MAEKAATASRGSGSRLGKTLRKYSGLYIIMLPVIIYFLLFHYKPMAGLVIAFQNYSPRQAAKGITEWVGLAHFKTFLSSVFFQSRLKNTLIISISSLVWGFPAPIILALMINELRGKYFAKVVQTITYLPHFISLVVICGMIRTFTAESGFITQIVSFFTGSTTNLLTIKEYFTTIYVSTEVWQGVGWGSIVYLAALTGINEELYEAASIDGAGRWKQTLHVTIPGIAPTIITMFILRVGKVMSVGAEKIILLYNEGIYDTADIIASYVYRLGLIQNQYSYSAAVGLLNSVVNFALVIVTNTIADKVSENSLW